MPQCNHGKERKGEARRGSCDAMRLLCLPFAFLVFALLLSISAYFAWYANICAAPQGSTRRCIVPARTKKVRNDFIYAAVGAGQWAPRRRNASLYLHRRPLASTGCWQHCRSINNASRKCINEFSAKYSVYKMQKRRSKMLLIYLVAIQMTQLIIVWLTGFQGAPRAWQRFEYVVLAVLVVVVPLTVPAASLCLSLPALLQIQFIFDEALRFGLLLSSLPEILGDPLCGCPQA